MSEGEAIPQSLNHTPLALVLQQRHGIGSTSDERHFRHPEPFSGRDIRYTDVLLIGDGDKVWERISQPEYQIAARGLIRTLGRKPSVAEVYDEVRRLQLFKQIEDDLDNPAYLEAEVIPQQEVIARRQDDFPSPDVALEAFRNGNARIETSNGVERLIITVPDAQGRMVDHPVMTTEEHKWVKACARIIAEAAPSSSDKVFIAGLGLSLTNDELIKLGVDPTRQVVAELNTQVIEKIGLAFFRQHGKPLDIRQGDWAEVLQQAVKGGELFSAVYIDAFPNTANEINRDASSEEALRLGLSALKPGGLLTFYPDSRYIPLRVLTVLRKLGLPDSSIHYTVERFDKSGFTEGYHYGDLMAVVSVIKPKLDESARVDELLELFNQEAREFKFDRSNLRKHKLGDELHEASLRLTNVPGHISELQQDLDKKAA